MLNRKPEKKQKIVRIKQHLLKPNKMQIEATKALGELRNMNETKALLISATGTGKTDTMLLRLQCIESKKEM